MSSLKPDNKSSDLNQELIKCQEERQEYLDGWRRARAEFLNYKKMEAERLSSFSRQANREILRDLLVVLDNLDRMEREVERRYGRDAFFEGVAKTRKEFLDVLSDWGVSRIETENQEFDPAKHEAIASIDDSGLKEGQIIEEILAGYLFNQEVLRPAKVKVAGANSKSN